MLRTPSTPSAAAARDTRSGRIPSRLPWLAVIVGAGFLVAAVRAVPATAADDRLDAAETVVRLFRSVDARDWAETRRLLAAEVLVDYASLGAGPPARVSDHDLVTSWEALLPGFERTQHLLGAPLTRVQGERAEVQVNGRAIHVIAGAEGGESWVVSGFYTIELRRRSQGWEITSIRLAEAFQEGNRELPALARRRAAGGSP